MEKHTQGDVHFYKIINTQWDTLFLLCKNNFFLSCEAVYNKPVADWSKVLQLQNVTGDVAFGDALH